jgi:hypothetical protein
MSALTEASSLLAQAVEHHDAGRPGSARRCIKNAQACVDRAIAEAPPEAHDPIANPTAATGAQTSNGQQPRNYSPEAIRARDQLRSVEYAYEVRKRQMRGLR